MKLIVVSVKVFFLLSLSRCVFDHRPFDAISLPITLAAPKLVSNTIEYLANCQPLLPHRPILFIIYSYCISYDLAESESMCMHISIDGPMDVAIVYSPSHLAS